MRRLKPNIKVFVGIPFLGTGQSCESFLNEAISSITSQRTSVPIATVWVTTPATRLGSQRDLVAGKLNDIIDRFLETDCTHVWLVNADCQLPPHALEELIRLDVDLVSGVSPTHNDWNETTVGWQLPEGALRFYRRMDIEGRVVGDDRFVATGNFCVLAKRRVFRSFSSHYKPLRYNVERRRKYIFGTELQFFIDACEMGYSVRVHGGVYCGHLPEWPLNYKGHEDTLFKKIRDQKWHAASV